ncbi:MAG: DUF1800 domain-containing protein [Bacteroidota bacterium]
MARLRLPFADAGLTDRQAAAHALDRLAFGPTPGAVDRVLAAGLETWIETQIRSDLPDDATEARVAALPDARENLPTLAARYRRSGGISREARAAGYIPPDAEQGTDAYREGTQRFMRERGLQNIRALLPTLLDAKLLRAVHAQNQLREVLADLWFNHFNVTARGGNLHRALVYDRDAIRPHVLAPLRTLLGATARHPAMLHYLDNAKSRAAEGTPTPVGRAGRGGGINENYGRELLELHTLGVDGGYTEADVAAAARAFTGWTVWPYDNPRQEQRWTRRLGRMPGVVREGMFVFRPDWHDASAKTLLGERLPAGRGMDEGERVLDLLAAHPSTARHLATTFAVRFVADDPPDAIVDHLADAFRASGGDTREVLRALVQHRAFWDAATVADGQPGKVKTPFELVVSALRATGAEIVRARALYDVLEAMGEPIYHCEPPTGFPDHASAWINPGLLLTRMQFGLRLATGGFRGIRVRLGALADGPPPASPAEALAAYGRALLPGRDLGPTADVLEEMVLARDVAARVDRAAEQTPSADATEADMDAPRRRSRRQNRRETDPTPSVDSGVVVGVLLGSPAFQRQ